MRKLFITLFLAACAAVSYAQDRIQVQVHRVVSSDEQFNVTFIIEGVTGRPDLPGTMVRTSCLFGGLSRDVPRACR